MLLVVFISFVIIWVILKLLDFMIVCSIGFKLICVRYLGDEGWIIYFFFFMGELIISLDLFVYGLVLEVFVMLVFWWFFKSVWVYLYFRIFIDVYNIVV